MSVQDRIHALKVRHQELETAIEHESSRPLPNEVLVHDLKRKKLQIKDEINTLSAS